MEVWCFALGVIYIVHDFSVLSLSLLLLCFVMGIRISQPVDNGTTNAIIADSSLPTSYLSTHR